MNPFSSGGSAAEDGFDDPDEFVPDHVPEPGTFLAGHEILEGAAHVAFHDVARDLFEERGVYDATFGYNLARLNLDRRHPDAGYRYAIDANDPSVLRAEFSPTTEFCPQADALVKGSFRAWNGLSERHEYDLVRVRVRESHHQADALNDALAELEERYLASDEIPTEPGGPVPATGDEREGDDSNAKSPF